jgi:hypothetical protein
MGGFECRLGARQSRVDFHVGVLQRITPNLPENFRAHPAWRFMDDFCREWVEPGSALERGISHVVLEFDIRLHAAPVPVPCVFLALKPEVSRDAQGLIEIILRKLGVPHASGLRAMVRRCLDALPSGAGISYLGAMVSRATELIRLNVAGMAPDIFLDYLGRIGWTGPVNELDSSARRAMAHVDYIELAFDLSDVVLPRIGLECFLRKQPPEEPRWPALLDHLVAEELCSRAKRQALLSWPGLLQRSTLPGAWPRSLMWGELFLQDRAWSVFMRRLNHVKLVHEAGRPVEAKAYLGFGHYWIDRESMASSF